MKKTEKAQDKENIRTGTSPETLTQALLDNLYYVQGRPPELATRNDWYMEGWIWNSVLAITGQVRHIV